MAQRAFITGITGQDGSYLAEYLLAKDYEVHGMVRRGSASKTDDFEQLSHASETRLHFHYGDLTDAEGLISLISEIEPDEIYNLGAQSHVSESYDSPEYTQQATGVGAQNVLEAARLLDRRHSVRVYQASSSAMYGDVLETPQNEETPFRPQSPYANAKVYAFRQVVDYRSEHILFAANGILFNHESPRRDERFVTRKISRAAARIKLGLQDKLSLGNLDAHRDWGYAKEYVESMWLMLQHDEPDDFVIATGESHSVRDFLGYCFGKLDLDWNDHVEIDPRLVRPAEVHRVQGDGSKFNSVFDWQPQVKCREVAEIMVAADLLLAEEEAIQETRHRDDAKQ